MKKIEQVFKAFADKNRLRILKLLEKKKMCVCEIAYILDITQPSVSRHLKKMKNAGLIDSENEGLWTNYFIKENNLYTKVLLDYLKLWINEDEMVVLDLKKSGSADRDKLCK